MSEATATILGTRLTVESWMTPGEARDHYRHTLTWDAADILVRLAVDPASRKLSAGRAWHVGDGVWLVVCGYCDAYALTYGHMPTYRTVGPHMVDRHGAQVAGINLGMLA